MQDQMNRRLQTILVVSFLTLSPASALKVQAQTDVIVPLRIDSYGTIACNDAMARLDYFAEKLRAHPQAFGYIVVYPERNGLPGKYRSYLDFAKEYLIMTRDIRSERLSALTGNPKNTLTTELWVADKDTSFPTAAPTEISKPVARKFDEGFADYSTYQGKHHLWTYDLCGLGALNLRAFAEQLHAEPNSTARLVIHLEFGKRSGRARTMARLLRDKMTGHNIKSERIVISSGGRRSIPAVELWVMPR